MKSIELEPTSSLGPSPRPFSNWRREGPGVDTGTGTGSFTFSPKGIDPEVSHNALRRYSPTSHPPK